MSEMHLCRDITCACGCKYCPIHYNGCPQCGRGATLIRMADGTAND